MEKKGLVKFISTKTFGVVLEAEPTAWYNPQKGLPVDLKLVGQKVVMDMVDNHTFRSIELDKAKPTTPTAATQLGKTDSLIVRQVAAKCASEMANTASEFKEIAEMVEKWILR